MALPLHAERQCRAAFMPLHAGRPELGEDLSPLASSQEAIARRPGPPLARTLLLAGAAAGALCVLTAAGTVAGRQRLGPGLGLRTGARGGLEETIRLDGGLVDDCHLAVEGEKCWDVVESAMTRGVREEPELYADLAEYGGRVEFQDAIHRRSPERCPRPCWPAPSKATCQGPLVLFDDRCRTAVRGDSCWADISWARTAGIRQHPEWYDGLAAGSSAKAFQEHLYRRTPSKCPRPCTGAAEGGTCICPPPLVQRGHDGEGRPQCVSAEEAQTMTFYMYQARNSTNQPLENTNAADAAGVMWYLHNKVVSTAPRKDNISRVVRFKVTVRNTDKFFQEFHRNFGPYVAFDTGRCIVPGCETLWDNLGFNVGCHNLDQEFLGYSRDEPDNHRVEEYVRKVRKLWGVSLPFLAAGPTTTTTGTTTSTSTATTSTSTTATTTTATVTSTRTTTETTTGTTTTTTVTHTTTTTTLDGYRSGVWYSLPGPCPSQPSGQKSEECSRRQQGGRCTGTTWDDHCTYQVTPAGDVDLEELTGVANYDAFVGDGGREYSTESDRGVHTDFWNHQYDRESNNQRIGRLLALFRDKYPQFPENFPEPVCS